MYKEQERQLRPLHLRLCRCRHVSVTDVCEFLTYIDQTLSNRFRERRQE